MSQAENLLNKVDALKEPTVFDVFTYSGARLRFVQDGDVFVAEGTCPLPGCKFENRFFVYDNGQKFGCNECQGTGGPIDLIQMLNQYEDRNIAEAKLQLIAESMMHDAFTTAAKKDTIFKPGWYKRILPSGEFSLVKLITLAYLPSGHGNEPYLICATMVNGQPSTFIVPVEEADFSSWEKCNHLY